MIPLRLLLLLFIAHRAVVANPLDLLFTQQRFTITNGVPRALVGDKTNLFLGINRSNQSVYVQRLATNGMADGAAIVLSTNGSGPFLSGNGFQFLAAWTEAGTQMMVQAIEPSGADYTPPARIDAADPAAVLHALVGDTMHGAVLWTTESSPGTNLLWLTLLEQSIPSRTVLLQSNVSVRFPALAATTNGFLIVWTERGNASNGFWSIRACAANPAGEPFASPITISSANASNAYPLAVHWSGTNALVAWTREVGPFLYGSNSAPLASLTNIFIPMIRARFLSCEGTPLDAEFEVGRARGVQLHPQIGFDGTNYLVVWLDSRPAGVNETPPPSLDAWQLYAQQITPNGTKPQRELQIGRRQPAHLAVQSPCLIFNGTRFVMACAVENDTIGGEFIGTIPVIPTRLAGFGGAKPSWTVTILGDERWAHVVQFSTNLSSWFNLNAPPIPLGPGQVTLRDYSGDLDLWPGPIYFRTSFPLYECISNLREIQWAKTQWALDTNKKYAYGPTDTDLFGPGRYLPAAPECPNQGYYTVNQTEWSCSCSIGAHQIWNLETGF